MFIEEEPSAQRSFETYDADIRVDVAKFCFGGTNRLVHSENSLFSVSGKTGELFSRAAAAVGLGIWYSMIVTGFTRAICQVHFHFEHGEYTDLDVVYFEARIQLAILFTASLFGVIWLSNNFFNDDIDVKFFSRALYKNTGLGE